MAISVDHDAITCLAGSWRMPPISAVGNVVSGRIVADAADFQLSETCGSTGVVRSIAIVLDLVQPPITAGGFGRELRELGFDEGGQQGGNIGAGLYPSSMIQEGGGSAMISTDPLQPAEGHILECEECFAARKA